MPDNNILDGFKVRLEAGEKIPLYDGKIEDASKGLNRYYAGDLRVYYRNGKGKKLGKRLYLVDSAYGLYDPK